MSFLISLIIHIAANAGGIYLAWLVVPDVTFTGDFTLLIIAGAAMGVINAFLKPILKILTLPLLLLSFGLFSIIINMFLLWLVDILIQELTIGGILPLFWATILISGINLLVSPFTKKV